MQTIGIITDTNSGMTAEEARAAGVILMPMPFTVNGKNYIENVNMSYAEFFECLADGATVATSQPSPQDVTACWDRALREYDKVIYIPMSSALSSSCQSAKLFAEDFDGRVLVADNHRISISQKQSVYDALHWRDMGLSAEEILQNLMDTALDASIYLTVDDLKYLKAGGRVSNAAALVGSMLGIKPVLYVPDAGTLDVMKKARGRRSALKVITDGILHDLSDVDATGQKIHILHADCLGDANHVREVVCKAHPELAEVTVTNLGVVIGAHCGPGLLAVFYLCGGRRPE